jgi:hypothetical protein
MRRILLLNCLLLLPFLVSSQETIKKADSLKAGGLYLDASGGVSIPMGYFARQDKKFGGSGFAKPGFLFQLNLDWTGKSNAGLGIQYTFQNNPIQNSVKKDTLSGMEQAVGSGSWTNHYLMAGLVFAKFVNKFYIEGKALIGVIVSSSPFFKTVDPSSHKSSTNTAFGPAYSAQFGVGYQVSPRIAIKLNAEYTLANPKINKSYSPQELDTITGTIIYTSPIKIETKRTVSAFMVKAGIVVKLSK